MHIAETVVAAIPGRPVSGSGCAAPQNSVCDHTQDFVPFSCHRGIQSAHHPAFKALESQVRCILTLQMSIKTRMTETRQRSVYTDHQVVRLYRASSRKMSDMECCS